MDVQYSSSLTAPGDVGAHVEHREGRSSSLSDMKKSSPKLDAPRPDQTIPKLPLTQRSLTASSGLDRTSSEGSPRETFSRPNKPVPPPPAPPPPPVEEIIIEE